MPNQGSYPSSWREKYDTYHIGSTDTKQMNPWEMLRVARWNLKQVNASDAFTIENFLDRLPSDQEYVVVKALVNNFKQASMVRDEVAMARFGTDPGTYTWMTYPPLTWSDTPGQNSWSTLTFNDNGTTTTVTDNDYSLDNAIQMRDDEARPMRMMMSHRWSGDMDYYRVVDILDSGLDSTDRTQLAEIFHPQANDSNSFTNEAVLDAITHVIQSNAKMVKELGRYSWYEHFGPDYYTSSWRWDY